MIRGFVWKARVVSELPGLATDVAFDLHGAFTLSSITPRQHQLLAFE